MKRTTFLTLAVLAGWAMTAAAQTPEGTDPPKNQAQKRIETLGPSSVEAPASPGAGKRFADADGNGVCDNCNGRGAASRRDAAGSGQGRGPGDGTGNQGVGPRDGTGRGSGASTGRCGGGGGRRGQGRGRGRR